jgi:hypothetical protein
MSSTAEEAIQFIDEELRLAHIELNTITGEMLVAQDKKAKMTGWRDLRARCQKRIERMETFLKGARS